ncbi:uncharacterized protein LOC126986023 [Eriocheir sinensis]|uniref:uncharacterized protein LOC126986023 n=1 Tax=Eriocheir sinensis TaxID=95602 RepID=UPI0021C57679|nr:uncharacterized protein LOC126986023 [Eriocheir sinensis]
MPFEASGRLDQAACSRVLLQQHSLVWRRRLLSEVRPRSKLSRTKRCLSLSTQDTNSDFKTFSHPRLPGSVLLSPGEIAHPGGPSEAPTPTSEPPAVSAVLPCPGVGGHPPPGGAGSVASGSQGSSHPAWLASRHLHLKKGKHYTVCTSQNKAS